jgi:protein-tyrosine phosphatase
MLESAGYTRSFCTPHFGDSDAYTTTPAEISRRTGELQKAADETGIKIALKPGGELRLSPEMIDLLPAEHVPTYGNARKYVICDLWESDWPRWAQKCVEWLQKLGLTVILAHPERLPYLMFQPENIGELARRGLLFQGNLGPIAGADGRATVSAAERFLKDGRYFMVGTDGHRPSHLAERLRGLDRVRELVGEAKLVELSETHPGKLWGS